MTKDPNNKDAEVPANKKERLAIYPCNEPPATTCSKTAEEIWEFCDTCYQPKNETNENFIVPYGQLTFDSEGLENVPHNHPLFSRRAHLPGDSMSGVTIGRGFDVGQRNKWEVEAILTSAEFPSHIIDEFKKAAGKRGSFQNPPDNAAYLYWNATSTTYPDLTNSEVFQKVNYEISPEAQKKLFEIIYPYYEADVIRWMYRQNSIGSNVFKGVVNWSRLDSRIKVILVDFKYRGDFFGRERDKKGCYQHPDYIEKYTDAPYNTLRELHDVIRENSRGANNYQDFVSIVGHPKSFPEICPRARDRFCARRHFLLNADPNQPLALSLDSSFTRNLEPGGSAYVPSSHYHDKTGITIGKGFNLRTRHCYKARELKLRTPADTGSFPKLVNSTTEEIVRPDYEPRLYLEAIDVPETVINQLIDAKQYKGDAAVDYLNEHAENFPTLTEQQENDLFDLVFPCYVSDAVLLSINTRVLKILNKDKNEDQKVKAVNWGKLKTKIKTILVDLCFTGDYHYLSREMLQKFIAKNDLTNFKNFLGNRNNWTKAAFKNWEPGKRRSHIAIPPTDAVWNNRFKARYNALNETPDIEEQAGLIKQDGDNSHALPYLIPAVSCNVNGTYTIGSGNNTAEIDPDLIPEFIGIHRTARDPFSPELNASYLAPLSSGKNFISPEGETEEDPGTDPDEDPLPDGWFKSLIEDITDIYLPHPTASFFIESVDSNPNKVALRLEGQENPVKEGYRLRFKYEGETAYEYRGISEVDDSVLTLVGDPIDFTRIEPKPVKFDISFYLPLNPMSIEGLLGDAFPAIESYLSSANDMIEDLQDHVDVKRDNNNNIIGIEFPLKLSIAVPRKEEAKLAEEGAETKLQLLDFYWQVKLEKRDQQWFLDTSDVFYLRFGENPQHQLIDFGIFTLVIPPRPKIEGRINAEGDNASYDAYFDINKREIGFTSDIIKNENLHIYFPGNMSDEVKIHPSDPVETSKEIAKAGKKRFLLELEEIDFEDSEPPRKGFLRLSPDGISIKAKVTDREVSILDAATGTSLTQAPLKDLNLKPLQQSGGTQSRIHIVNNTIKEATLIAKMLLPGFKTLEATVGATLKQKKPGEIPSVEATIALDNNHESALYELQMSAFQMQLNELRMSLEWIGTDNKWNFSAFVDANVSLTGLADIIPDLKDLQKFAAIQIENLDLQTLNVPNIKHVFNLKEPTKIDVLDGMFTCQFDDLAIDWHFDSDANSLSGALSCKNCRFRFNRPSVMDVEVEVGALQVQYKEGKFKIKIDSGIGIKAKIGTAFDFEGQFGWLDEGGESYLYAGGKLGLEALPKMAAFLKLGSVRKSNGELAPNIVVYAERDIEKQIYTGVVLKTIGGGVGINNRLAGVDSNPTAREIIENIDEIQPDLEASWSAVKDGGLYISIVASALFGSNIGLGNTFQAYVMRLVLSFDTNLKLVAAGKAWIASSLSFIDTGDNEKKPALVGAFVFDAQKMHFGFELESRKKAAIQHELLKKILNKTTTRISFRLTPEIVDYHLQELSYQDNFLGFQMKISGYYRIAVFRRTILTKAGIKVFGYFDRELRGGPGGFSFKGKLDLETGYGGIFGASGIHIHGYVNLGLEFEVKAWIEVGFSNWLGSWHETFNLGSMSLKLGISGNIALSNGSIGFDGTVSIRKYICGHRLSISPKLSYNKGVIKSVNKRVSAFERLLDSYGDDESSNLNKLLANRYYLNRSASLTQRPFILTKKSPKKESMQEWLHYVSEKAWGDEDGPVFRHTYLPSQESEWFTPYFHNENPGIKSPVTDDLFVEDVKKIAVGCVGDKLNITSIETVENTPHPNIIKIWLEDFNPAEWKEEFPIVLEGPSSQNIWYIQSIDETEKSFVLSLEKSTPNIRELNFAVDETFNSSEHTLFKPKLLFYTPWLNKHSEYFDIPNESLQKFFLASTLDKDFPKETPGTIDEVIYDPRFESPSRDFMPREQQLLPEDILSAIFKPLSDIAEFTNTSRNELAMIKQYEDLKKRVGKEENHHVFDLDIEEQQKKTQATIIYSLMADLNETSDFHDRMFDYAPGKRIKHPNGSPTVEIFGLIHEEQDVTEEKFIYVQRGQRLSTHPKLEKIRVAAPDQQALSTSTAGLRNRISLLKIRQDYVTISDQDAQDELGKIIISLPIKLDPKLFEDRELSQLGNFRLYRKTHENDTLTLIADQIQPRFTKYRERYELKSGFVAYDGKLSLKIGDQFINPDQLNEETKGYEIEVGLDNGEKQYIFNYNKEGTLSGEISALAPGNYFYSISLVNQKAHYLVNPFLFKDEINIKNRKFDSSNTSTRAFAEYYLEILPTAENKNSEIKKHASDLDLIFWNREYLYIPEKNTDPEEMRIVFSVKALDLESSENSHLSEKGSFILQEGENFIPWNKDPNEFEIWVKEMPLQQTGFYGGGFEFTQVQPSQEKPFLESLDTKRPLESVEGKHLLHIDYNPLTGRYTFRSASLGIFRPDSSYQFYIGFKKAADQKLLPLDHFITDYFPNSLQSSGELQRSDQEKTKEQKVLQIEWLPAGIYTQISNNDFSLKLPSEFLANGIHQLGKNYIETQFNSTDLNAGGVEIFFIDQDEPGFAQRQLIEIKNERSFIESELEFREASAWRVPHWEMIKNQSSPRKGSIFSEVVQEIDLINTYYTPNSQLVLDLTNEAQAFIDYLTPSNTNSYHWKDCYSKILFFFKHLARFERSSLNIDSPLISESIESIKNSLIELLLGIDFSQGEPHNLEELAAKLTDIQKALGEDTSSGSNNKNAEDKAAAWQLIAVIHRRLAIVNDLFTSQPPEKLPDPRNNIQAKAANHLLPSLGQWIDICKNHQGGDRLKHTQALIDLFLDEKIDSIKERINNKKAALISKIGELKDYFSNISSPNTYLNALSRVVPIATDLTSLLDGVRKQFGSQLDIQKNMHHSVNIDTSDRTHRPAEDVELKFFNPDNLRLVEGERTEVDEIGSQNNFIVAFFNLMEYLGFAVDVQMKTKNYKSLKQHLLIKHLNEVYDPNIFDSYPFILRGIASNTTRLTKNVDGFSFVKIAFLPRQLFRQETLTEIVHVVEGSEGTLVRMAGSDSWPTNSCYAFQVKDDLNQYQVFHSTKIEKNGTEFTFTLNRKIAPHLQRKSIVAYRYSLPALKKLLDNRNIQYDDEQIALYQQYFTQVAFVLDQFSKRAETNTIPEIYLEGISKRWLSLPVKGGVSQAVWEVPDRFGHRYQVGMRTMSRYEPLIKWQLGRHSIMTLPDFKEISSSFKLVHTKPVEHGVNRQNEEQMLLTYHYPHPSKAYFSYQLPTDAARSLKNQVASVRTGYKGCDLVFSHELFDSNIAPIGAVLNAMTASTDTISHQRVDRYSETLNKNSPEPHVRLFDHERMMTLTNLQYYHRYFMNVRSVYDSHEPPVVTKTKPPMATSRVEPSNLYTFQPRRVIQTEDEEDLIYDFTLFLTRHIDNLTGIELSKEPHSLEIRSRHQDENGSPVVFQSRDIPDLSSIYRIYWRVDKDDGSESFYVPIISLHMPWSENHGNKDILYPRLRDTNTAFRIDTLGSGSDHPETTSESKVPIEFAKIADGSPEYIAEKQYFDSRISDSNYQIPDTFFAYKVKFSLRVSKELSERFSLYNDRDKFALQLSRKQSLAAKVDFKPDTSGVSL